MDISKNTLENLVSIAGIHTLEPSRWLDAAIECRVKGLNWWTRDLHWVALPTGDTILQGWTRQNLPPADFGTGRDIVSYNLPYYSTRIQDAWQVFTWLKNRCGFIELSYRNGWICTFGGAQYIDEGFVFMATHQDLEEMAICRAGLVAALLGTWRNQK